MSYQQRGGAYQAWRHTARGLKLAADVALKWTITGRERLAEEHVARGMKDPDGS